MPWWALLLASPFFAYAVWAAIEEWLAHRRNRRALQHMIGEMREARRIASTLEPPVVKPPLDVRAALRRDRRSP
jgi:biopolymer transport protein ExbB/TolQ